jgi:branched-chain amino acid transport system permease protein
VTGWRRRSAEQRGLSLDTFILSQYVLSGVVIGVIYSLMALGITFIYSIMKMINWGMGEFYMIGSYVQYALIVNLVGPRRWYLALPLAMGAVFVLGLVVQRFLLRPMFVGGVERRDEYATIITIALMVFFRNLAIVLGGPNQYAPPDYAKPVTLGTLPISGNRFVALIGTLVLLGLFYLVIKKTWIGRALRGAAQNRVGIQTAGIDVLRLDMLAFGVGVSLAAAAGALLAPDFLVYPENGAISTFKGFEIIVIGGLGSILGSVVGGVLLGVIEALGSVFVSAAYKDLYGFLLLIALLVFRPTGLFGERERSV